MLVHVSTGSEAAWELPAVPASVGPMRRHAAAFALAVGASEEMTTAVQLAVSETVTNAVIHAYVGREPGRVSVRCQGDGERMIVEVIDDGALGIDHHLAA
jgi:serine/threonine-protein kinase RsbW